MSAIGKPWRVDRTPVSDLVQPQGIGISRTAPETRFGLSTSCRLPVTPRDTALFGPFWCTGSCRVSWFTYTCTTIS